MVSVLLGRRPTAAAAPAADDDCWSSIQKLKLPTADNLAAQIILKTIVMLESKFQHRGLLHIGLDINYLSGVFMISHPRA